MTNVRDLDDTALTKLRAQGYIAIIYAAHSYGDTARGDVISKHKTRAALETAERRDTTGRWAVMPI